MPDKRQLMGFAQLAFVDPVTAELIDWPGETPESVLAASLGITIARNAHDAYGELRPRHTAADSTIRAIIQENGEDHARLVLRSILAARHNESALIGGIIKGVSMWIAEGRYDDTAAPLIAYVLRRIRLTALWRQVKEIRLPKAPLRFADRLAAEIQGPAWAMV